MPDKHEVGGSSPLGPTSNLRVARRLTDLIFPPGISFCREGVCKANEDAQAASRRAPRVRGKRSLKTE